MEPKAAVEADADDDYMGDLSHFLPPSPRKAEAALAQLENREVEPPAPDGEEKENGEEDEEEVITEEGLQIILDKLRDQHLYCLYCGCKYESREALANECPGPNEEDH